MPLYEYHCPNCQTQCELLMRDNRQQATCPNCGHQKLERLLSVAAAPAKSGHNLPVCPPPASGCGRPQCGSGQCMFGE
ncbi:MAG: zinc ribbon domain-containing protein [Pirellulaceae bacterium]|nr:zinc ribbon domain-containing protein [Pirellulaceae bacterium]